MKWVADRVGAVIEVLLVKALVYGLGFVWFRSEAGQWQMRALGHWFGSHTLMIAVPVALLVVTRRSFAEYGLTLRSWRDDVRAALGVFFPMAVASAVLGFVPYATWPGAVVMVGVQVALLWVVAKALRKPDVSAGLWTVGLSVVLFGSYGLWKGLSPGIGQGLTNAVYYLLFIGVGEEVMNRGYALTRLNQAFDKPWRFLDVSWGWGTLVAAALFGLGHVLNGYNPITGAFNPQWAWGLWTTASALVFTYVREKTGSVVAPAILHGLPQALVYAFLRSW